MLMDLFLLVQQQHFSSLGVPLIYLGDRWENLCISLNSVKLAYSSSSLTQRDRELALIEIPFGEVEEQF